MESSECSACATAPWKQSFTGLDLPRNAFMDTARIKQRLNDLRDELLSLDATSKEAASVVELDQTRVGRLSRMDALQAQAISSESRRRQQLLLKRIQPALDRLENGDYGICVDCDQDIAPARLDYDPTCSTCIGCADKREQRAR